MSINCVDFVALIVVSLLSKVIEDTSEVNKIIFQPVQSGQQQ